MALTLPDSVCVPGTVTTVRFGPGGGMPKGSRAPWTTRVGTVAASSSSRRVATGFVGERRGGWSGKATQITAWALSGAAVRQATRAPEERPPRIERRVDELVGAELLDHGGPGLVEAGRGRRRAAARDAVGLLDQRHREAGGAGGGGDGLEVGGVDGAARAVAEHQDGEGIGGGMDVRPGEPLRGLELEHGGRGGGHRAHACTWDDAGVDEAGAPVRVDKWLWAARLVKTRALAAEAVKGGRVHLNGQAVKPSRDVRPGDELELTVGTVRRTVVVRGTAERRGPAKEAELLYEETADSVAARERAAAERRLLRPEGADRGPRPTKRDRRRLEKATGGRRRDR